jgi:hypothetical protein
MSMTSTGAASTASTARIQKEADTGTLGPVDELAASPPRLGTSGRGAVTGEAR